MESGASGSSDIVPLNPPEAYTLLNIGRYPWVLGQNHLKIAVYWIFAQGILRLEQRLASGWFGKRRTWRVTLSSRPLPSQPPLIAAIADAGIPQWLRTLDRSEGPERLQASVNRLSDLEAFVDRLASDSSVGGSNFLTGFIYPPLRSRGLISVIRDKRFFGLFPVTRAVHTAAGAAEKKRIEELLRQAKDIPMLLQSHPARAAALVARLGDLVLLVRELRPIYNDLAAATAAPVAGGEESAMRGDAPGPGASFDFRALADMGAQFAAIDAAFLSSGDAG